ncbi:MAG: heme-copper oxidase subunit III [Acidobacteria bacterium]|nr:MAG: heme-copper oxidase subunit III [Acidobacteriota bacterium]
MSTAVQDPPQIRGSNWNDLPPSVQIVAEDDYLPQPSRTGVWIGLAAITMTFAAFTSALIVSQGSAAVWKHIELPPILFLNTVILLISSCTLEIARRGVADYARHERITRSTPLIWLSLTLFLGVCFVGGQYAAWLQLRSEGLFLATTLGSSFFYVLTAVHALHLFGGIAALTVVIRRFAKQTFSLRKSTMDSTAYYWHFMSVLWLYLLWILWLKL